MTHKKSTQKKRIVSTAGILLLTLSVIAVSAVACGGHRHEMSPKMMHRLVLGEVDDLMDEVDATDAQRAAFESAAKAVLKDALALKEQHKNHDKALFKALRASTPDRRAIYTGIDEHAAVFEAFARSSVDRFLDAYETLDTEQRQIVIMKLAEHFDKH